VKGSSQGGDGVIGFSNARARAGVSANNTGGGLGLYAGGAPNAAQFDGAVQINGNLTVSGTIQPQPPQTSFAAVLAQPATGWDLLPPPRDPSILAWLLAVAGSTNQQITDIYATSLQYGFPGPSNSDYWNGQIVELALNNMSVVTTIATINTQPPPAPNGIGGPSTVGVQLWHGSHKFAAAGNLLAILWTETGNTGVDFPAGNTIVF
jgi:hypothetical protein